VLKENGAALTIFKAWSAKWTNGVGFLKPTPAQLTTRLYLIEKNDE